MKQGQFEQLYQPLWQVIELQIIELEKPEGKLKGEELASFASRYRRLCHFHALAKDRHYSSHLVDKLGDLVVRGHQQLYRRKQPFMQQFTSFIVAGFPRLVREQQSYIWWATALLYIPGLLMFLAILWQPDLVYTISPPEQVSQYESMYDPQNRVLGSARDSETNVQMFGFYISNNIGVSFRTFASGILFGVGSIFFLVFNGLLMGAVAGHLTNAGFTETFFTFVVGHGSFELTAIAISGAAGLKLGYSLLAPGNLTRKESLKRASKIAIQLVYGVIVMLVIAAFIEAFWSSNNILDPWQKYLVGGFLWAIVIGYLVFSGRGLRGETATPATKDESGSARG
ncbi:MAG: stage II sporulation protein M [Cellvibrio sp.]|uniref:stage II sporulation protein M n=1 Tax=Cellvibrio sp. TaxID=1965322 RepID=UPI0031A2ED7A